MKKATKIFVPIMMVALSLVMLTTASFAWFTMNTKVTATGMEVTAKSDSSYLQIKQGGISDDNAFDSEAAAQNASHSLKLTKEFVIEANTDVFVFEMKAFTDSNNDTVADAGEGKNHYFKQTASGHLIDEGEVKKATNFDVGHEKLYKMTAGPTNHPKAGTQVVLASTGNTVEWYEVSGGTYTHKVITAKQDSQTVTVPSTAKQITFEKATGLYTGDTVVYADQGDVVDDDLDLNINTKTQEYTTASKTGFTTKSFEVGMDSTHVVLKSANMTTNVTDATGRIKVAGGEEGHCYVKAPVTDSINQNWYKVPGDITGAELQGVVTWFTANSTNADQVQETNPVIPVETSANADFFLANKFTLKLGGKDAGTDLKVAKVNIDTANHVDDNIRKALRVVVVATKTDGSGVKTQEVITYKETDKSYDPVGGVMFNTMALTDMVEAEVYIFFDGTDAVSKTSAQQLDFVGYKVEVVFEITPPAV